MQPLPADYWPGGAGGTAANDSSTATVCHCMRLSPSQAETSTCPAVHPHPHRASVLHLSKEMVLNIKSGNSILQHCRGLYFAFKIKIAYCPAFKPRARINILVEPVFGSSRQLTSLTDWRTLPPPATTPTCQFSFPAFYCFQIIFPFLFTADAFSRHFDCELRLSASAGANN